MSESRANIRLTMDGQQAVQEANKVRRAAKGVADEFNGMARGLAMSIVGLSAVVQTLDRAADAAKRVREETAEANRGRGGAALQRGAAARAMGLTATQVAAYRNIQETGAVDEAEQVAFMEQLAKSGGRVRGARGLQYAQAFATGAFTQAELLEAAKRGRSVDINRRMSALGPDEQQELALRRYELEQTRRTSGGLPERLALIERERQRRDSPGATAFVEGVEGAPGIGGLVREATMGRLERAFGKEGGSPIFFDYRRPMPVDITGGRPQTGVRGEGGP